MTYKPKARAIPLNSAAWQRIREQVLAEQPLCPICTRRGLVVPAVHVDHINNDGDDNRRENLQALCHECHSLKTAQDMGKRVFWGCDANGIPLDPSHPWRIDYERERAEKSPATEPLGTGGGPLF